MCDLTAGFCDINCCCDFECTEEEIAAFELVDGCLDDGPEPAEVLKCWDDNEFVQFNNKVDNSMNKADNIFKTNFWRHLPYNLSLSFSLSLSARARACVCVYPTTSLGKCNHCFYRVT